MKIDGEIVNTRGNEALVQNPYLNSQYSSDEGFVGLKAFLLTTERDDYLAYEN